MATYGEYESGWHRFTSYTAGTAGPGDSPLEGESNLLNADGEAYADMDTATSEGSDSVALTGWNGANTLPSGAIPRAVKLRFDLKAEQGSFTADVYLYDWYDGSLQAGWNGGGSIVGPDGSWSNQMETHYALGTPFDPTLDDWIEEIASGDGGTGVDAFFYATTSGSKSGIKRFFLRNVEALVEYDLPQPSGGILLGAF